MNTPKSDRRLTKKGFLDALLSVVICILLGLFFYVAATFLSAIADEQGLFYWFIFPLMTLVFVKIYPLLK